MKRRIINFGKIFAGTFRQWVRDKPFRQSAVIAYFAIFSIPALLVLVFNFASLFIEKKKITDEVTRQIEEVLDGV